MHTHGPTKSEGNLTPPPGFEGANQGASLVLPRAASPGSSPRSERGPLAQGNATPSQGTGTSAQGYGPPGSMGQSCLPAHENGHPHGSQGQGCPRPRTGHHLRDQSQRPYLHPKPSSTPSIPIPATSNPPLPIPSPLSLPAASQLPRALADSPAANSAEPSTCPSPALLASRPPPLQTPPPPQSQLRALLPSNNQREHLDPNRHWEETAQQQVQGATAQPAAPPPPAAPPVIINNYAERAKSTQIDEDGYTKVKSRNQRKRDREHQTPKPLKGADRPDTVYLLHHQLSPRHKRRGYRRTSIRKV
nr:proline-rich protein 36-like [Penaeus vannamei]